jgi:N utilization substance protein A
VRRLFELEVPELVDGVVEIRAVAREPGHRTKLAVASNDQNVDPVGACVGARGMRVRQVVNELRGEKVDIVPFSSDGPEFVMRALAPAKVREVRLHEDTGIAEVIVPDFQLSLAIGKEGQNARLAARLTGWRVDIKSESQLAEEESGGGYAEGEWVEGPDGGLMWQPAEGGEAISAAEAGYATLGEGAPTEGATAEGATGDGAPAEGTTSDGSPDSPDAGEQIAVAPEEAAMHVEASVADEAADEIAADADLGIAEADIRTEANQEIEETATPETVEES